MPILDAYNYFVCKDNIFKLFQLPLQHKNIDL